MNDLLPCPFCGGKASQSASHNMHKIGCEGRGCCYILEPYEANAITAWNTRAGTERVKVLEAKLRKNEKITSIHKHAVDKWVPCPDHRDKIRYQCYVCENETLRRVLQTGLNNLAQVSNVSLMDGHKPHAKTAGYMVGQIPEWQIRQALTPIEKTLEESIK